MSTKKFLQAVVPDDGLYCAAGYRHATKTFENQAHFETLDELIAYAHEQDDQKLEAFFALGSFKDDRSRKGDNVVSNKAFFFDIDCGKGKDYDSQNSGLEALRKFCKAVGFPQPLIVSSGYGLHVYWPFEEAVSPKEWKPYAERLKKLCLQKGMKLDAQVTADAARVLRVPGTHNHKDLSSPQPVRVLNDIKLFDFHDLCELINEHYDSAVEDMFANSRFKNMHDPVMDNLAGNKEALFKPILKGCGQMQYAIEHADELPEPLWRSVLSIAMHCKNGEKNAHRISAYDTDRYDPIATDKKMSGITTPHKCQTFYEQNPAVCEECPHLGKINSPMSLGMKFVPAVTSDEPKPVELEPDQLNKVLHYNIQNLRTPPKGYSFGRAGGMYVDVMDVDDEGNEVAEQVLLYPNYIQPNCRLLDPDEGQSVVVGVDFPKEGIVETTIPVSELSDMHSFKKRLGMIGVALTGGKKWQELQDMLIKWLNKLQAESQAEEAKVQFGWHGEDGKRSFVVGDREYLPNGTIRTNHPTKRTSTYIPYFKPKGTLEKWKEMADWFNRPGMEINQYVLCCGFASPLMEFVPNVYGVLFHLQSDGSGAGKTTTMYAAASVFGDYKNLCPKAESTKNFAENRLEVKKNMFFGFDEMTNFDGKYFSDFAYGVTSGEQKGRMGSSANRERSRGNAWSLIVMTTANASALDRIRQYKTFPDAELMRIMEVTTKYRPDIPTEESAKLNDLLVSNWGTAGHEYIRHVVQNQEKVRQLVLSNVQFINNKFGLENKHRFWAAKIACVYTGWQIASSLGLVSYSEKSIVSAIKEIIKSCKQAAKENAFDPMSFITSFYYDNHGKFFVVRDTGQSNAEEVMKNLTEQDQMLDRDPFYGVVGRYDYTEGKLFIRINALKDYCADRQVNYREFVEHLKKEYGAEVKKVRLGKGLEKYSTLGSVNLLSVNFDPNEAAQEEG